MDINKYVLVTQTSRAETYQLSQVTTMAESEPHTMADGTGLRLLSSVKMRWNLDPGEKGTR